MQEARIALRLPPWLLDAVDEEVARRRRRPGASVTRSDVIREILARALRRARGHGDVATDKEGLKSTESP